MRSCSPDEASPRSQRRAARPGPLFTLGYDKVHQSGSHLVLVTEESSRQRIAVPAHSSLRVGTLSSILRTVASHKRVARESIIATF